MSPGEVSAASDVVRGIGATPLAQSWLEAGDAFDILARGDAGAVRTALEEALPSVDVIVQRAVDGVRPGGIVLLHDGDGYDPLGDRRQTASAIGPIVRTLEARGYEFCTVGVRGPAAATDHPIPIA